MSHKVEKYLYDISNSIEEIESFFNTIPKDFFSYIQNVMLKRAVERNLEIIGEAVNKIIKLDPTYLENISEARSIIGLRNLIIHAYDNISDENIWAILINHLPKLKSEVEQLLKENL
ncbi:HepT-like ribonuclease domain-containing protein [Riemerella columbina]|uniref:HepT-like ribonuclease domain-containing protein n=1 Tax=Riemerella columbina TaxID=103810 RepID=UPI00037E46C6|nr:HepT-like ribonuclease domain-containing protein [Riemerella columbina]